MQKHSLVTFAVFAAMILVALFVALPALADGVPYKLPVKRADTASAAALGKIFAGAKFTLDDTRRSGTVPRIFVRRLPDGIAALPATDKESVFIRLLLPLVAKSNQIILQQRQRLQEIQRQRADGWLPDQNDRYWLSQMARAYNTKADDLDALLRHVDVIPASLALAQGIVESAWGIAGPAQASNGLFGDHAPAIAIAGGADATAFPSLLRGVLAYMYNLNVAPAYAAMRQIRADARQGGDFPSGDAMAGGLVKHPAGGPEYVTTLREVIAARNLADYDRAVLAPDGDTMLVSVTR